jgi:AcrR family transcriptional regulator
MASPARGTKSASRRRPPRQPLSAERIIDVAGAMIDKEGIDALTMRRLAEELGVAATAIYWHVRTRDDLLRGILERSLENVQLPPVGAVGWDEGIRLICRSLRDVLTHPHIVALSQRVPSESTFRPFHRMVDLMVDAGFDTAFAVESALLLQTYVNGQATAQDRMTSARTEVPGLSPESLANWFRIAGTEAALLLDSYLNIDQDKLFERGLEDHIAGIERSGVRGRAKARQRSGVAR